MNDYKLPIIEPTIDYTKVPPINQKRTISFINHFIVHTVTFLNKFALTCEEKLFEFENKLQRIEASLEILESWLSSVPGPEQDLQDTKNTKENISETKPEEPEILKIDEPDNSKPDEPDNPKPDEPKTKETDEQPAIKDPRYEKYLKMIHIGVPRAALKLKIEQEGLDSSVLDELQQIAKPKLTDNVEIEGN